MWAPTRALRPRATAAFLLAALLAALALYSALHRQRSEPPTDALAEAFRHRVSGVLVEAEGDVVAILPDDREGSAHQRFIVRLASGQTVLVAHNIDLARRVAHLERGDHVRFRGQYEWNDRGGVVHWTHRDPDGRQAGGWVEHRGHRYR